LSENSSFQKQIFLFRFFILPVTQYPPWNVKKFFFANLLFEIMTTTFQTSIKSWYELHIFNETFTIHRSNKKWTPKNDFFLLNGEISFNSSFELKKWYILKVDVRYLMSFVRTGCEHENRIFLVHKENNTLCVVSNFF
jgi:hypothetical protein